MAGIAMAAMTVLVPLGGRAADAPAVPAKPAAAVPVRAAVAADFLEYLAAFEGDDENWTDFEVVAEEPPAVQARPAAPKVPKAGDPK